MLTQLVKPKKVNSFMIKRNFFTIIHQYEEGKQFKFGQMDKLPNSAAFITPDIRLVLPFVNSITLIDMKQIIKDILRMYIISPNNATYEIDALISHQIINASKTELNITNIGQILSSTNEISNSIISALSGLEQNCGINISNVQIKDIQFDHTMKTTMAIKAEAKISHMAISKLINTKADIEISKQYKEAAIIYQENPLILRLKEFILWSFVSKNQTAIIYVIPSYLHDFISPKKNHVNLTHDTKLD